MDGATDASADESSDTEVILPETIAAGSTILVSGAGDPAARGLCLRALCHYSAPTDTALVVSTTESEDETRNRFTAMCRETDRHPLAVVDTVSKRQYLPSMYTAEPTVFTTSPGDLERIVLALSDLTHGGRAATGTRHLVVRSLTPMLEAAPIDRVRPMVERITGLRTDDGYGFFGLDFTAHDEQTMAELVECVDGILWFTTTADESITLELRSTRAHLKHSSRT